MNTIAKILRSTLCMGASLDSDVDLMYGRTQSITPTVTTTATIATLTPTFLCMDASLFLRMMTNANKVVHDCEFNYSASIVTPMVYHMQSRLRLRWQFQLLRLHCNVTTTIATQTPTLCVNTSLFLCMMPNANKAVSFYT